MLAYSPGCMSIERSSLYAVCVCRHKDNLYKDYFIGIRMWNGRFEIGNREMGRMDFRLSNVPSFH